MATRTEEDQGRSTSRAIAKEQYQDAIRLSFKSVKQIVVEDDDGDRWVTTVREAAQACRAALNEEAWKTEFEGFLHGIREWAQGHADVVSAAYVGVSSEGLTGVILTKGPEYRLDFDDEVTKLDIDLAKRYPTCRADVMQSPEDDPEGRIPYLSLDRSVQVYGNPG